MEHGVLFCLLLHFYCYVECHYHRHLSKWHVPAALFASLVMLMAAAKKDEKKAIKTAPVAGT
jgi:hypothetical protein